jgi:transposase
MPRYNNAKKTHRYTEEFKAKAVQLSHLESVQVQQIAESLGIHPFMLSRWRKEYREGRIVGDRRKRVTKAHKGKEYPEGSGARTAGVSPEDGE